MTKKTATPDEITDALALREAGYTTLAISQRLGISIRSLQRHFAIHGAKKGTLKQDAIDAARTSLLMSVTSDDAIREEAARLITDDLAHARHLRTIIMEAADQLKAESLRDAVLVMRAAAAYATALKATSDTLRHTLRVDRVVDHSGDDLPELVVRELSQDEIEAMRSDQMNENELMAA